MSSVDKEFVARLAAQRSEVWNKADAILQRAISVNRDLTAAEQFEYDAHVADLDKIAGRVKDMEDAETRTRVTEDAFARLLGQPAVRAADATTRWLPGLAEYREMLAEQRAVGTTGAFIGVGGASVFFDQLRKRVAVLAAGPQFIAVEGYGSLKVPAVTASVTVGGVAENTAITPSDPTLASITLDPKKLAALTLVAREAIEDSNPDLQQVVANSLLKDFGVELDRQFIAGDGTGQNMTGLTVAAGTTAGPALGVNGAALAFAHLADTLSAYESANNDADRAAWLMHPRTWASVRKLADLQSRPIVSIDPTAAVRQTLWGVPVFLSSNFSIAQTVGTSTDTSTILLADMSQVVVGVSRQVEIQISTEAYFAADQVALKVTGRYDIGLPQPAAVVKTVGIRP